MPPHVGPLPLDRLSRPVVERWVSRLLETGSSPHAAGKGLAALKVNVELSTRRLYVRRSVWRRDVVKVPKGREAA